MTTKKSKSKPAKAPRKRLTSERPLKHRPADPEPPEAAAVAQEASEATDKPEPEKLKIGPRQKRLPTMEDPKIEELEAAAEEYVDIRDQRMALTPEEHRLQTELLGLMHKHNRVSYVHAGCEIKVIVTDEKVRVKIAKRED